MHHSLALALAAAAWIAGTAAAALIGLTAWPLSIAACALILTAALITRHGCLVVLAVLLPILFLVALQRFEASHPTLADDDVAHYIDGPAMRVRGVVRDDPTLSDASQRFTLSVREIQRAGAWEEASGGVQITTSVRPRYEAGDVVEVEGRLEAPPQLDDFDYADFLARRGVHSTLTFPDATLIGHEDAGFVRESLATVRARLSDGLELALPEPQASLAKGVLLGEKSALPPELRDDLNTTNTSHLVVVSGGNIAIIASIVAGMFAWLVGRRWAMAIALATIVGYMLLVGLSPPVVRGTIMGALLLVAQLSGRRSNGFVLIAVAAAVMLAINPQAIRDVSFQLSFAATAGIVVLAGPLVDWFHDAGLRLTRRESMPSALNGLIVAPLSSTLAAIIGTTPLVALNFGRVSVVALPANMLVVPAFPYILLGSALAAVGGLLPFGRLVLAAPAYYLLSYWIAVVETFAAIPGAALPFSRFNSAAALISYAVIALTIFLGLRFIQRPSDIHLSASIRWRALVPYASVGVPVAVLITTAGFALKADESPRLRVSFLDVGQGDAILIQTPSGDDVLIDGGPGRAVLRGLGEELAWHDRGIEMMILTHPDADHLFGLYDVLERYDVAHVLTGAEPLPSGWGDAVERERAMTRVVSAGLVLDLGDGVTLEVISPLGGADSSDNNASLVMRLVYGEVSFLLTADIEAEAEEALITSGAVVQSTVLKVAHHGSKTSSTAAFLEAVAPSISVISAGANNQHGHPHAEVVDRLDDYGPVLTTADSGSISIETDGTNLWVDD